MKKLKNWSITQWTEFREKAPVDGFRDFEKTGKHALMIELTDDGGEVFRHVIINIDEQDEVCQNFASEAEAKADPFNFEDYGQVFNAVQEHNSEDKECPVEPS